MKRLKFISIYGLMLLLFQFPVNSTQGATYIIYYATHAGKTGHIGVAISNYKIIVIESANGEKYDTITTPSLKYFDLWPNDDEFSVWNTGRNITAEYYKLPLDFNKQLTISDLFIKGIPHKEYYPTDGIIKIETTWQQDDRLEKILDSTIEANRDFNGRKYNCADFVEQSLESLLHIKIKAKEFIGLGWSTTPNKLYRKIATWEQVEIIKNPGKKCNGSFLKERVLTKILNKRNNNSIHN